MEGSCRANQSCHIVTLIVRMILSKAILHISLIIYQRKAIGYILSKPPMTTTAIPYAGEYLASNALLEKRYHQANVVPPTCPV